MAKVVCARCGFEKISGLKPGYRNFWKVDGEDICDVCVDKEEDLQNDEEKRLSDEKRKSILFSSTYNGPKWQYLQGYTFTEKGNECLSVTFNSNAKIQKILYKIMGVSEALDELGQAGWELISTTPIVGEGNFSSFGQVISSIDLKGPTATVGTILWFKRQIE